MAAKGFERCYDFSFSTQVATNVETTKQAQPADFTCLAYHALKAAVWWTICGLNWEPIYCFLLHPRKLTCPQKRDHLKRKFHLQTVFFKGYVSFRGNNRGTYRNLDYPLVYPFGKLRWQWNIHQLQMYSYWTWKIAVALMEENLAPTGMYKNLAVEG